MEKLKKAIQDFQVIKDYYKNLYNLEYHEKNENIYFPFQHTYITTTTKKLIDFIMLIPKKIETYDSFVFEVYIFLYEDGTIECSDGYGTFEKFEAYEGSDLPFINIDKYKSFINCQGLEFEDYEIFKVTSLDTFKEDVDLITQTMLTLNDVQESEPYIKYPHYEAQTVSISYPNKFYIENHLMKQNFTPTFEFDGDCGIKYYVKHFIHLDKNIEYRIHPNITFDGGKLNEMKDKIKSLKCISAFHNNLAVMGLFVSENTNLNIIEIEDFKNYKLIKTQKINEKTIKKYEIDKKIVFLTTFSNKTYLIYIERLSFNCYDEEDYIEVVNELEECAYFIFETLNTPTLIEINDNDYNLLTNFVQSLKPIYNPYSKQINIRELLYSALYFNVFSKLLLEDLKTQILENQDLSSTQKQIVEIIDKYI